MAERAYVISDTHLGAGKRDPLEDFDQDDAFARFVGEIAGADTILFINGDFVDFAQIPPFDVPKPCHLLWDEEASLKKIDVALREHASCFGALKEFLRAGGRLQVLIGNHDFDFVWKRVQARVRRELGDPAADRFGFTVGAETFHGVHIEHGYEFTPENCPRDPKVLTHTWAPNEGTPARDYLERVWGTDFMLQFYNDLERDHPYADNIKPLLSVVYHGLKNRWVGGRELLRLLVFLKRRGILAEALVSSVLSGLDAVDAPLVAASFAEQEWQQAIVERAHADPGFVAELKLAALELEGTEHRIVVRRNTVKLETDPRLDAESGGAPNTLGLFREDREQRAARERLGRDGVTAVVFGHTHRLVDGNALQGTLKGRLFNPGTWLPHLDLTSAHVKQKIKQHGLTKEMLKDESLYRTERWAVRIDADPRYAARVRMVACDDVQS